MIQHLLDKIDSLETTIDKQRKSIEKMADEIATYTRMLFETAVRRITRILENRMTTFTLYLCYTIYIMLT